MAITQKEQIAWAAGFFDGEGCIGIYRINQGQNFRLHISAGQKNNDLPLLRLQALFGGRISRASEQAHATAYWNITSKAAGEVLQKMLPYLTVKKEQAELGIAFQNRRLAPGKRNRWSSDLQTHYEADENDFMEMSSLKGRG